MKGPSFASVMAAAATVAGASFVAVGATKLDNQTSKAILKERGLPAQYELIEQARRFDICVERVDATTLRVTGPGGPEAAKARNPELYEQVAQAVDVINWYEIRC
ncbi:MAG TPA: hypothetical protein VM841_09175 [Actinomycetota bacterium]|nr:hypothetical protein [Actinomycetota bacterium]